MIRLRKSEEPQVLKENGKEWTSELLKSIVKGDDTSSNLIRRRYADNEVKENLRLECSGKCMYCESRIGHITYEHVEHIKPKAKDKYPELTFSWENLGLSCPKCNLNKSDFYDDNIPFVNPYVDEPSNFFVVLGHFIYHRPGNRRGEITEKKIQLNRVDLIEQRKERIDAIRSLADKYVSENNTGLKQILLDELKEELQEDKPYSACASSVFHALIH